MKSKEFYRETWKTVNSLRGNIDEWDFKDYILCFFFYRYISEDFSKYVNERVGAGDDFDYSSVQDEAPWIENLKETFIEERGYFMYPSQLFSNVAKRSKLNSEDLNIEIGNIFREIKNTTSNSDSRNDFIGLFELINLNDIKLGSEIPQKNKKIKEILTSIENIEIDPNDPEIYGEIYEYLIGMYAFNKGKDGGELYTPSGVSELLARLVLADENRKITTIYDPVCGSGSSLLKFLKISKNPSELEFYGQEINFTTFNFCRMNMFLHNLGYEKFEIKMGDVLMDDKFKDRKFDGIVAHLPHSPEWKWRENPSIPTDPRFSKYGAFVPSKKAEFAFIQHSLHHLENHGVAAILCFPGILWRGNSEGVIRKYLIRENYIDAIIQLPEKLILGSNISTSIMVLKKVKKEPNILFIDATQIFTKGKGKNEFSSENIDQIMDIYNQRKNIEGFSKLVKNSETEAQNYLLTPNTYVIKEEVERKVNLEELKESIRERTEKLIELRRKIDDLISNFPKLQNEED